MKNRIERSRTDLVPVPGEFFCHARAKDQLLLRMMENVEADHSGIEIAVVCHIRKRRSLSRNDIMARKRMLTGYMNIQIPKGLADERAVMQLFSEAGKK